MPVNGVRSSHELMNRGMKAVRLIGSTDGDGALTLTSDRPIYGLLYAMQWIDGAADNGVDAALSYISEGVTVALLTLTDANSDAMYYPRADEHDNVGASQGAGALPVIDGVLSLAVTSGGANKAGVGSVVYYFEE